MAGILHEVRYQSGKFCQFRTIVADCYPISFSSVTIPVLPSTKTFSRKLHRKIISSLNPRFEVSTQSKESLLIFFFLSHIDIENLSHFKGIN